MKLWMKLGIGGVGLAIVGTGGYFLWRYLAGRKKDDEDEPIEVETVRWTPERYDDEPVVRDEDDPVRKPTDIRKEKLAKSLDSYMTEEAKENFEEYLAGMESPEEDEDEEFYDDEEEEDIHRGANGPYEITAGEFCNTRSYYDKTSVNYFVKDDVVADDRDTVMGEAMTILGNVGALFSDPNAPDIVYIRNEALEADYEVSKIDGSYRKEVLHLDEEG